MKRGGKKYGFLLNIIYKYNNLFKFIVEYFNARGHHDVKFGKKAEDDVMMEFYDTFETHHALRVRVVLLKILRIECQVSIIIYIYTLYYKLNNTINIPITLP